MHLAKEEQKAWERSIQGKLYWLLFHFQGGLIGLGLIAAKVVAVVAGCWCLTRHKAKRSIARDVCTGFTHGEGRLATCPPLAASFMHGRAISAGFFSTRQCIRW